MDKEKLISKDLIQMYASPLMTMGSGLIMASSKMLKREAELIDAALGTVITSFDDYKYHVVMKMEDDELKERYSLWRKQRKNFKRNIKKY